MAPEVTGQLKASEKESTRLKGLVADQALDIGNGPRIANARSHHDTQLRFPALDSQFAKEPQCAAWSRTRARSFAMVNRPRLRSIGPAKGPENLGRRRLPGDESTALR